MQTQTRRGMIPADMELLSVPQVAEYLQIGKATIQRWCFDGTLPAAKIGKHYRIRRGDLDAWYEAHRRGTPIGKGA